MGKKILMLIVAVTIAVVLAKLLMGHTPTPEEKFAIFNDDLNTATDAIVAKIKENPSVEGVAAAREILNQAQPFFKRELADIKALEWSHISFGIMMQFRDNMGENRNKLKALIEDPAIKAATKDKQFKSDMGNLLKDYNEIIQNNHQQPQVVGTTSR